MDGNGRCYSSATVESATPLIYRADRRVRAVTASGRLLAAGIAVGCLIPLLIATQLRPSPDGLATHRELGLPSCAFLDRTGIPCPTCGMTTSWSWFVRGNLAASLYIQPMGTVLAILAVCCVQVGAYVAITGRPIQRLLRVLPSRYYFLPLLCFGLAAWGWKIFLHLSGRDGWH